MTKEELEKENAELKDKLEILISVGNICTKGLNDQLTKAKELIKKLKALYFSPVVTKEDVKRQDKILAEAEQFIREVEE